MAGLTRENLSSKQFSGARCDKLKGAFKDPAPAGNRPGIGQTCLRGST